MDEIEIYHKLKDNISGNEAPITGRKVACLVVTDKGRIVEGFNHEEKQKITHVEEMVISKLFPGEKIEEIHLMASGSHMDAKNAIPCKNCVSLLSSVVSPDTKIKLYFINEPKVFALAFGDIEGDYMEFSDIPQPKNGNLDDFLKETPLAKIDQKMLAAFLYLLKKQFNDVKVYMTGTSSGRGGPKGKFAKLISGVSYLDIDLIIILSGISPEIVDLKIKKIYADSLKECNYQPGKILSKVVPSYRLELNLNDFPGFIFRKIFWEERMEIETNPPLYQKNPNVPSSLDISVGVSLEATITPDYLKRKWYIKLI